MKFGPTDDAKLILTKDDVNQLAEYFRSVMIVPSVNTVENAEAVHRFYNALGIANSGDEAVEPTVFDLRYKIK